MCVCSVVSPAQILSIAHSLCPSRDSSRFHRTPPVMSAMKATSIMEAPMCLIETTPDGKVRVNPDALKTLSQITQTVVVVTVVGACRTGKSYLMNRLAGEQKVFDLGHTVQAKTKGIWMWCQPHPVKKDQVLVLLDTQGLGDVEKCDTNQDTWIFSLALLLSSVIVYNSTGTINQDAINKLHFVKQIANVIKVKAEDNDNKEAEFSRHFPSFVWVVRDFELILEIDGKPITEDEYLEHALKPQLPETTKEMNMYKHQLQMYFNTMKCFVFDRPTYHKTVLRKMEDASDEQLDPSFITKSKECCEFVFNKAEVKRIDGIHPVNGRRLGLMAQEYAKTINSSNLVCMESAVMNVSDIENKAAVQEATKHYEDKMIERVTFPTDSEPFMTWSRQCEKEALQIFIDKSLKDEKQQFQIEFVKTIQEKKKKLLKMTEEASRKRCEDVITDRSRDLEKNVDNGVYNTIGGYGKFLQRVHDIENIYRSTSCKGVQAEDIFLQFFKSKMATANAIRQSDNALSQKEKEMEEDKAKAQEREMERKIQEEKESQLQQRNDDEERTAMDNALQMLERIKREKEMKQEHLNRNISANQIKLKKCENENRGSEQVARLNNVTANEREEVENMDKPTWYEGVKQRLIHFLRAINIVDNKIFIYVSDLMEKVFCFCT